MPQGYDSPEIKTHPLQIFPFAIAQGFFKMLEDAGSFMV